MKTRNIVKPVLFGTVTAASMIRSDILKKKIDSVEKHQAAAKKALILISEEVGNMRKFLAENLDYEKPSEEESKSEDK